MIKIGDKVSTIQDININGVVNYNQSLPITGSIIIADYKNNVRRADAMDYLVIVGAIKKGYFTAKITEQYIKQIRREPRVVCIDGIEKYLGEISLWYADNDLVELIEAEIILPNGNSYKEYIAPNLNGKLIYDNQEFEVVEKSEDGKMVWVE